MGGFRRTELGIRVELEWMAFDGCNGMGRDD